MGSDLEFIRVLAAREKAKAQWHLRCTTDALRKAWESLKAGILKLKMPPLLHAKAEAQRIEAKALRHAAEIRS